MLSRESTPRAASPVPEAEDTGSDADSGIRQHAPRHAARRPAVLGHRGRRPSSSPRAQEVAKRRDESPDHFTAAAAAPVELHVPRGPAR